MSGWVVGIGSAALSVGGAISGHNKAKSAAKDAKRRALAEKLLNMTAANRDFALKRSMASMQRLANDESTTNAIQEVSRAGGAQERDIEDQISKATSSYAATSEGLTSGRTQGKNMASLLVKGTKALLRSDRQEASAIIQIADMKNKKLNEINMGMIAAGEELSSAISTGVRHTASAPGFNYFGAIGGAASSGISMGGAAAKL